MRRFPLAVAILAVLVVATSACSESGEPVTTTDEPTPAQTVSPTASTTGSDDNADGNDSADDDNADGDAGADGDGDGDGDGGSVSAAEPSPTPIAAPTATPTPAPAPTPSRTPSTLEACRTDAAGDPIFEQSVEIDADGDREADAAITYGVDSGGAVPDWRLRVETATGASLDSPLRVQVGFDGIPRPLGGADIGGNEQDELFTLVGAGASTAIVAIHVIEACELVGTDFAGFSATFAIGGTVGNLAGLQCVEADDPETGATVIAWTGEADFDNPGDWELSGTEYRLDGAELVETGTRRLRANVREADFVYGQLTCGEVVL